MENENDDILSKIPQWQTDIKDWKSIPKDVMSIMVDQSEKALQGKVDSLELSTKRADQLLSIYIPLCTALSVYVLPKIKEVSSNYLVASGGLALIVTGIGLYFCIKNIRSFKQCDIGFSPRDIIRTEYVDNELSPADKLTALSLAICRNTQLKCDINETTIAKRSNNNQNAIKALIFLPACPIIIAIIFILL